LLPVRSTGREPEMSDATEHGHEPAEDITRMMLGIGGALLVSMVIAYFVAF